MMMMMMMMVAAAFPFRFLLDRDRRELAPAPGASHAASAGAPSAPLVCREEGARRLSRVDLPRAGDLRGGAGGSRSHFHPLKKKKRGGFEIKGEREERGRKSVREREARERKRPPPPPRPPTTTKKTHLRAPPDAARDGEDDSKHRQGDAHGPQADARIEVDVRVEVAADKVPVCV